MADSLSPASPSEAYWNYVPRCAASAQVMVRRARAAGRTLAPSILALAGEPVEPAAADVPPAAAEPPPAEARAPAAPRPGASSGVFSRERRVRFLDHLAVTGSVRAAAAQAGVSHETAYRARRQDVAFADLWDAALVHARDHSGGVLATRALDGVAIEVWYHGEVVGTRVHHDPRLLLAHLARLDRQVEGNAAAQARAGRFDELLAGYSGLEPPVGFELAAEAAPGPAPLPPTREGYVAWLRNEVTDELEERDDGDRDPEERDAEWLEAVAEAEAEAGAEWDGWRDEGRALLAAIVASADPGDPGEAVPPEQPPVEVKSVPRGHRLRRSAFSALDTVTSVTSPAPGAPARIPVVPAQAETRRTGCAAQRRHPDTKSLWRAGPLAL